MTTIDDDADLREALRGLSPTDIEDPETIDHAWDRIQASRSAPKPRRRWLELATAACLGAGLVIGGMTVAGQVGGSDSTPTTRTAEMAPSDPAVTQDRTSEPGQQSVSTVARDASAVVATDDVRDARDEFVARIETLQGRVTSESSTTTGRQTTDIYPPVPVSPGISLSVEVPADRYDEAVAAIAPLGEIVQFSQSAVDQGDQYAQTTARIASLKASLATLRDLLTGATSVSDVIALEDAIAQRQSELDALVSEQQYLRSQVSMARISLSLMTDSDAAAIYGGRTLTDVLIDAWVWVGRVLLWTSPLWVIGFVWWWMRRRRV